jgi:hypothetical protein
MGGHGQEHGGEENGQDRWLPGEESRSHPRQKRRCRRMKKFTLRFLPSRG